MNIGNKITEEGESFHYTSNIALFPRDSIHLWKTSRTNLNSVTVDDMSSEKDEESVTYVDTDTTLSDSFFHELAETCGRDSIFICQKQNVSQKRNIVPEEEEESLSSVDSDFTLSDSFVCEIRNSFGRDSILISKGQTFPFKRDSTDFSGVTVECEYSEEDEESIGSTDTDYTLSDSIIYNFECAFGRDSFIINQERGFPRQGRTIEPELMCAFGRDSFIINQERGFPRQGRTIESGLMSC